MALGGLESVVSRLSPTAQLKMFGLAKIPLLFLVNPKVLALNNEEVRIQIPLSYMTKNHVGSMYFGALAIGADAAVAMHAIYIEKQFEGVRVTPVFADLKVDFLKRAETDVIFVSDQGPKIRDMIAEAIAKDERITAPIDVKGVSAKNPEEVFATFTLGLSLRAKKSKK